jgi:hypothetical protein
MNGMGSKDSDQGNFEASRAVHEEFLEPCAIATTGALRMEEWLRLMVHLEGCSDCCKILGQYESLIGTAIPQLLALSSSASAADADLSDWSLEEAEALLFVSLNEDSSATDRMRRQNAPDSHGHCCINLLKDSSSWLW